jgi:hypothetical protein
MKDVSRDMANAIPTEFDLSAKVNTASAGRNEIHLHVGTLIADDYGIKELERKLKNVRIQETYRLAGGVA